MIMLQHSRVDGERACCSSPLFVGGMLSSYAGGRPPGSQLF